MHYTFEQVGEEEHVESFYTFIFRIEILQLLVYYYYYYYYKTQGQGFKKVSMVALHIYTLHLSF